MSPPAVSPTSASSISVSTANQPIPFPRPGQAGIGRASAYPAWAVELRFSHHTQAASG